MTNQEIISEITSRDTHKVWNSSCKIIEIGQDTERITKLIPYLDLIKDKTKGLKMGGGFGPNQRFVDFAIRILEYYKTSTECSCNLYLEHRSVDVLFQIVNVSPKKQKNEINCYCRPSSDYS